MGGDALDVVVPGHFGTDDGYDLSVLLQSQVRSCVGVLKMSHEGILTTLLVRRANALSGHKEWLKWTFLVLVPLTWGAGITMAVLSFFWAKDPFDGSSDYWVRPCFLTEYSSSGGADQCRLPKHHKFGRAADHFPVVWMGLSAVLDGLITVILVVQ